MQEDRTEHLAAEYKQAGQRRAGTDKTRIAKHLAALGADTHGRPLDEPPDPHAAAAAERRAAADQPKPEAKTEPPAGRATPREQQAKTTSPKGRHTT